MMETTWRNKIKEKMNANDDSWENIVMANISPNENINDKTASFDRVLDDDYGSPEGDYFTVWTRDFVYFPCEYDGSEYVGSVPRNPIGGYTKRHI